jgi:hypothetical protein
MRGKNENKEPRKQQADGLDSRRKDQIKVPKEPLSWLTST